MTPEHTQSLHAEFPSLLPKEIWFYCGDGWYALLRQLFADISRHATEHGLTVTVESVREKYASLRVSTQGEDAYIERLVLAAEEASTTVCDECGEVAQRLDDGWWITTRCDAHRTHKGAPK